MTKRWRGQSAVLEVEETDGGATVISTAAILDNPFIAVPTEVQEGRGTGETTWFDIQETEKAVLIGGDILTMDIDAWDRLVGWDEAAGELDHSPDVPTFTATITIESADGSTKEITAGPGYKNNDLELGGGREEWLGMTLELRCNTIQDIVNTDAQA